MGYHTVYRVCVKTKWKFLKLTYCSISTMVCRCWQTVRKVISLCSVVSNTKNVVMWTYQFKVTLYLLKYMHVIRIDFFFVCRHIYVRLRLRYVLYPERDGSGRVRWCWPSGWFLMVYGSGSCWTIKNWYSRIQRNSFMCRMWWFI
jgi:hypothetical protein